MKEILKMIIENLVENKEDISIGEVEENGVIIFKVKVNQEEMGKVIGKQGKIAHSIRTLMRALGAKEQKKVDVEFVD